MRRVFPAYGVRFIAINDNVDTENDAADDLTVSVKKHYERGILPGYFRKDPECPGCETTQR